MPTPSQWQTSSAQSSSLWRNRDYLLLWSGQAVSETGSWVSTIAYPLLILALTGSAAAAGLLGAFATVPYAIIGLLAGALVDRWDRKRVMILCDAGRALAMLSIPVALWLGRITLVQIYLVALIAGTLYVFFSIAESAALPRVVRPENLSAAVSQNSAATSTAGLVGPSLGGVLFQLVGRWAPFLADGVSYAVSVVSLLFMRTEFQQERVAGQRRLREEMGEGLASIPFK